MSSITTSGSFVLKASRYNGSDPILQASMNKNPELFDPNQMMKVSLAGLKGNYKFKIKYLYILLNKNLSLVTNVADATINPQCFFVSPQICSYATNENFATVYTSASAFVGTGLGGNLDHEFVANVDGYLNYNIIFSNPAFGSVQPYPAINPFAPYQAGFSVADNVQPYWGSGAPNTFGGALTVVSSTVLINWESLN
jgi:hypothetical protein